VKVRKNVRSLSQTEIDTLVNAFLELKKRGRYDTYVHWHHHVMIPSIWSWEPNDPDYRNGAHRGPSFLPWHREFLLQLEEDLRSIDASITIPYWDWTEDAADPVSSPLWSDKFLGGNGVEGDHWRVADGPFAYGRGNWPVPAYPNSTVLINALPTILVSAATGAPRQPSCDQTSETEGHRSDRIGNVPLHRREPHAGGSLWVRQAL
jgi:tyrosinase